MEDLVEFALKELEKNKVTYAEVRYTHSIGNGIILKNQVPQVGSFEENEGIGIRYILNNALGFLSTNELEKNKIKELIERNLRKVASNKKINDLIYLESDKTYKENYEVKQKIKLVESPRAMKLPVTLTPWDLICFSASKSGFVCSEKSTSANFIVCLTS